MEGTNHCPECGEILNPQWRHCPWCGAEHASVSKNPPAQQDGDGVVRLTELSGCLDALENELDAFLASRTR
ncbi:MAG: zinc ribbon domain-containing protein [Spirochaetales bacterium]|nr:zinc ribbon domain-containing protein [Spirochaetales bacterium]